MKITYTLVCTLLLAGCTTPQYNYEATTIETSEPPIESVNTAYVGDILLTQGKYAEHDALRVTSDTIIKPHYTIHSGYFLKTGSDEKSDFYRTSNDSDSGDISKSFMADGWKSLQVYKTVRKMCVITIMNAPICVNGNQYERVKKRVLSTNSFQQTLIYSGRIGDKINISYREFSNDFARPAFNNDVEYDLSSSNQIGYKGAKIEIIEATNEFIKYKVIKNFNQAQQ